MSFKKLLDNTLKTQGMEIRKSQKIWIIPQSSKTRKVIEFTGPPGVGKTTIMNAFIKKISKKGLTVESKYLNNIVKSDSKIKYNGHVLIFDLFKESLDINISSRKLEGQLNRLQLDLQMMDENLSKTLVADEWLFKAFGKELKQLNNNNLNKFKDVLRNRTIVYVKAPPEKIYSHIQTRNKTWGGHKHKTKQEIILQTQKSLQSHQDLVELAETHGAKVITLDAMNSVAFNADLLMKELIQESNL